MRPKSILVFLLFIQFFCMTSVNAEEELKYQSTTSELDPKKLSPLAISITLTPDYYEEGEGPEDEDYSEDTVDTEKAIEVESKPKEIEVETKPKEIEVKTKPKEIEVETKPKETEVETKPKETEMETKSKETEVEKNANEEVIEEVRNTPSENVEMAVGGISGIVNKLIKGPKRKDLPKNSSAEKVYIYMSKMFAEEIEKTVRSVLPRVYDYTYTINDLISQKCFNSLAQFGDKARNGEPWALRLMDASAKFTPYGIMDGTFVDLGNFDQCLRVEAFEELETGITSLFRGKYCLMKLKMPLPPRKANLKYTEKFFNFKNTSLENTSVEYISAFAHSLYSNPFLLGICAPSTCVANDIHAFFHNFLEKFHFKVEVGMDCYSEDDKPYLLDLNQIESYQIISIAVIGFMSAIVGLATVYELYTVYMKGDWPKYDDTTTQSPILCFSAYSNAKKLFSLKSQSKDLRSINGIKVIAIIWVVIANVYLLGYQPQLKSYIKSVHTEMSQRGGSYLFQFILNSWNASEIFFLISGFLVAYTTMPQLRKRDGKISLVKCVLNRWIRFTPSLVYAILLVFLLPLLPNGGPMYKSSTTELCETCENNWWKSLLFISNWFESQETCLPHTWFISASFQLHLIGIIVLLLMYKKPQFGRLLNIGLIAIGIIVPAFISYKKELPAISPIMNRPLLNEIPSDVKFLHFLTFNHFSTYFIGIAMGVALSLEKKKHHLNILIRAIAWIVLPPISIASVVVTFYWNDWKTEPSTSQSMVYYGLHRVLFISSVAWIIYECVSKRAGYINSYLSHKLFLPLSRLTYQIYLLNMIIIWFYFFTKRDLIGYRDIELLSITAGIFVFTTILSVFVHLVFEAPFSNLFKHFFRSEAPLSLYGRNTKNGHNISSIDVDSMKNNGKQEQIDTDGNYNVRL